VTMTHVVLCFNLNSKPELLRGIYDMKFHSPSKIQESTLPALLADPLVFTLASHVLHII